MAVLQFNTTDPNTTTIVYYRQTGTVTELVTVTTTVQRAWTTGVIGSYETPDKPDDTLRRSREKIVAALLEKAREKFADEPKAERIRRSPRVWPAGLMERLPRRQTRVRMTISEPYQLARPPPCRPCSTSVRRRGRFGDCATNRRRSLSPGDLNNDDDERPLRGKD